MSFSQSINLKYGEFIVWAKMIRENLTDMTNEWQRRKALDSTRRFNDFRYDNNMDASTPDETEIYQRKAQYLLSKGLLDGLDSVNTCEQKIAWLKRAGLCGVYDNNLDRIVRFDEEKLDLDYVDRVFRKEIQSQIRLLGEIVDISEVLNN